MALPEDLAGMVLVRGGAAAALASVGWARAMRANRVAVAGALQLSGRLAQCSARVGDVGELEAIRTTIGTINGRSVAAVAAANQQWEVLAWCARLALLPEDFARHLAAQIRLVWGVSAPWKEEILVWDEYPKRRATPAEACAEMGGGSPECLDALRKLSLWEAMHLYGRHVESAVGSEQEMWWPSGDWPAHRVLVVCSVMSDIRPLGRYKVRLESAHREWPREVPIGFLTFDQVEARFESIDASDLPERVGIAFCAWWMPMMPRISVPFVCGGGLASDGFGVGPMPTGC